MIFLLPCLLVLSISATADPLTYTCEGGNYTTKSTFQSNLNTLLASLSSAKTSFTTDAKGSIPNRAYGLILCRGDVIPADCSACLNNAMQDVLTLCPVSKQATIWYDSCELRYSDLSFFSIASGAPSWILINVNSVTTNIDSFIKLETKLLDYVTYQAAYNSTLKFATGIATSRHESQKIYALAQCTRDLSTEGCSMCLQQIRESYKDYVVRVGGRVLGQSCNFRYEAYPFFAGQPTLLSDVLE